MSTQKPTRADAFFAVIPEWVIYEVSPRALQLYAVLRRHADDSGKAWPSRTRLSKLMACSVKTVDRTIGELVEVGALDVEARLDDAGDRTSNLYTVRATRRDGTVQDGTEQDTTGRGGDAGVATPLDIGDATGGVMSVAGNQSQVEPEPKEGRGRLRRRDLLWECFVEIHGEPATKSERGKYNRAVAKLRQGHVDEDEYPLLVGAYVSKYNGSQPAVMTVAERIGEMRNYVKKGPVVAPNQHEVRERARRREFLEGEEHDDAIRVGGDR